MDDQEYDLISQQILKLTGIDLAHYKVQQMRRRLTGLSSANAPSVAEYCQLIKKDPDALSKLRDFLTINVSEFFRDAEQFEILRTEVFPELLKNRPRLNVWSAGCSHGGEPYSVAMMLEELAPGQNHRVLATDLDDAVIAKARNGGPYTSADVNNVDGKLLLKYFDKPDNMYTLTDQMRKKVTFKIQNLLRDVFETGFDLIMCRNVVIYFNDEAKDRLYRGFQNSLRDRGVLFIGATESLLAAAELGLTRVNNCFYRKSSKESAGARPARAAKV
ncbi:MAG: protein-glutamate O-methyltransferase CheR [Chloroflexi bacterium]|nr:protein-glutamate O-methyltransferase CheR [Chloroflexota bacterium]